MRNGELLRNPYVPDAIYNSATDTDGDGMSDIFFAKRPADIATEAIRLTIPSALLQALKAKSVITGTTMLITSTAKRKKTKFLMA